MAARLLLLRTLTGGHTNSITSVAISPDGTRIASGGMDFKVVLRDTSTGQRLLTLEGHTNQVYSVVFSPDGRWVTSISGDRTIRIWDASSGQQQRQMSAGANVWSVAYSPDGQRLAVG